MMRNKYFFLLFWFVLACATNLQAMPIYSIATSGCHTDTGAIIKVDPDQVSLLKTDGRIVNIPRSRIEGIAEYYVVENPIARFNATSSHGDLFEVATEFYDQPFLGYAVGFVDQTALFFDQNGHIRVVEVDHITALRHRTSRQNKALSSHSPTAFEPYTLPGCRRAQSPKEGAVGIEKIYAKGMQSNILLNRMQIGYQDLASLAERTSFFYKPLVFDQETRIGIRYSPTSLLKEMLFPQPLWESLPIYFSSSSGRPYRFQTHFEVGTVIWDSLPIIRPTGGAGSYFKSHIIHGELILNFDGFSAGKPVFSTADDLGSFFSKNKPENFAMAQSFNHLTLLGLDYSSYSFSFGSYYPTFALRGPDEYRGITPPSASLLGRVSWQSQNASIQLLYFNTDAKGDGYPAAKPEASRAETASNDVLFYSQNFQPQNYSIRSHSARINWHLQLDKTIKIYGSGIYTTYDYREDSFQRLVPLTDNDDPRNSQFESASLSFSQTEMNFLFGVHLDLSKWVALGGSAFYKTYDSHAGGWKKGGGEKSDHFVYQGMFEILL